ncbi:hypothetical protein [Flavobacterium sp. SORGH_AS_0622]|uniref:hypothetical protein n=1 Tax=Flavobacterium sp. SORGH_AS_0622 TaxID=3041772 RepID=UPI00278A7AC6|nr:hypothetical protein [Flavobacterium sp. SORGH_AS_0622]MDQ1165707.1 hypothetical protein [Flavobacterium sp. SORGH_AS_0622]
MNKMYPLEWFDSLIINSLDIDNSTVKVSEYELENLSKTIVSESKKIKIHIKNSFFELKSKRQIRLLIRKYHSSLVFLLDKVVEIRMIEKFNSPEFFRIFDLIVSSLDDLLSFVETRYSSFMSLDQRVSCSYFSIWKKDTLEVLKNVIKKKENTEENDPELEFVVNLLAAPLQYSRKSKYTYRQILYYREIIIELEKLNYPVTESEGFSNLDLMLIRMNFNSREYTERLVTRVGRYLEGFENLSERLERLLYFCKKLSKINADIKLTFNPSQQNLILFLEYWFSSELRYVEKKTAIEMQQQTDNYAGSEFVEKADSKLECMLSGDQIGLILRATDEARIIKAKSMNYIFKSIVPYLSTPVKRNLSYQSVRSNSYNAEERDKEIAIESLEKIIRKIKTY